MTCSEVFLLYIIEDNEDDYFLLASALKREGITCRHVWYQSGEAGLAALTHKQQQALPHLLMSDFDLPGISGYEVLTHIREDKRLSAIPVIIFTSSLSENNRILCNRADHYCRKPNHHAEWASIIDVIKNYVHQHERTRDLK